MAHTKVTKTHSQNTGAANTFSYSGSFDVFKGSEVVVLLDGIALTLQAGTIDESASPREYTVDTTAKTIHIGGADLSSGTITIRPETDLGNPTPRATYAPGASVTSDDLNNNQLQLMRKAMEYNEQKLASTGGTMTGNLHLGQNVNLTFEGSAEDAHETTLTVANPTSDKTITLPDTTGTVITTGDTGTVTSTMINDGTIVNADVNASAAIAGTKISPDFGSQNIATTGTVNGVSTTELSILDGATVTTNELNILDGVTATTNELNILDGVTATATELNVLDGITATTAELNQAAGITSGIQSQIDGKQPLDAELTELATMGSGTAGALADLNTAEVQTLDGLTSSTAELNLLDGKSIVTTIGGSATDVQIPSAQAVNERIVELVTEVGGFAPIANETSFPATNPDINDGAGTIVSIKALASNLTSNGSGVATIANGAGSGNTVTINGMADSDTIEAGKGILVETTTTLHTYTFHREVIDPAGVTNASSLVSDFNDRYQVSGSAPSTHPDGSALGDGDLWFDTNANVMKVYDLGNTQYNTVASVGDFKLLTVVPDGATSGSPTFNGSIVSYDLRDDTNAASITNVGQLFVSLNGVIQKPNAGSYNASNEGFYLEGTNGIKFCTAPASGSSIYVTQIGAATGIGTPSDNTVTEAKLTSDAVSEAKLKVSNSPVNGYFLSAQSGNTGGLTWTNALGANLDVQTHKVTTSTNNGNVQIEPNGTGVVEVRGAGGADGTLQLNCSAQSHGVKIKSPAHSAGATYTLTLPVNIQNGYFLTTDANGQTSWTNSAANLTAIPAANITGTLPAISGANLTDIDAGATGTGNDKIFWENGQTVTGSYTIGTTFGAACNAMSAGPITINNNVVVTVGSGNTWTIV
tara:strand:+ start:6844 stop:9465 length:2622 start_codon:yes stop_codon:yes gene_type:complete